MGNSYALIQIHLPDVGSCCADGRGLGRDKCLAEVLGFLISTGSVWGRHVKDIADRNSASLSMRPHFGRIDVRRDKAGVQRQ